MKDMIRLAVIAGVMMCTTLGWGVAGHVGAVVGLITGLVLLVAPWRGLPLGSWAVLYLGRNRRVELSEPLTLANDRSGGGVRYQDDVAVVAVQLLGRPFQPTLITGSMTTETTNTLEVTQLVPAMKQSLGLIIESISVISSGARRGLAGDYPRVYDTLIGTPPYAGQRATWLLIRIRAIDNGDALHWRSTVGTAALAAAQRIAMTLRCSGIRARTATAIDIVELERRLGRTALEPHNRRWNSARTDAGWQAAYAYRPADITTENLAQAWSLRADGIVQNVTIFPDGTASATVTVRSPQPPTAPPAVMLHPLRGEQAQAVQANLCCARPELRALIRGQVRAPVTIPIGPSGVLLGKTSGGDRLLMPLSDPGEQTRIQVVADDEIVKRILIRAAAAGERITIHTTDLERWESVRMPQIAVIEHPRPAAGTTLSVVDSTVRPAPRPNTVLSVASPGSSERVTADVLITQIGPTTIEVEASGERHYAEMEFFRAESRYIFRDVPALDADLEMAE